MAKMEDIRARRSSEPGLAAAFGGAAMPNLDPLFQVSNRLIEGWMAVSTELLEFGKSRLDRGFEASRAIAQSTSLNEAIDLQAKFTQSAVQDYLSEANKLADLGTRSLLDTFTSLQRPAQHAAERVEAAE